MSWNEELVQDPIRPAVSFSGHSALVAASRNLEMGVDRSGVKGPFICGSNEDRSISMTRSYSAPSSAWSSLAAKVAASAISGRCVDLKYESMAREYGKMDVVAPVSAPMLQMVAMPVADRDWVPGPKYSMIFPVPPLTVRIDTSWLMTSV
jgi:hypothetical protein